MSEKTPVLTSIVWTGPEGHYWPHLSTALVAGQRYQVEPSFAAYLVERHPDLWQRPPAPPTSAKTQE